MNTALLLTGHMRTFERCLPTLYWHVLRHYPGIDVFVSTIADEDSPKVNLLLDDPLFSRLGRVEVDVIAAQPDLPIPVPPTDPNWQPGRNQSYTHEPYALSVPPLAVLRQLWQLNQAWQHFTAKTDPTEYDLIIRARPDSWFHFFNLDYGPIPNSARTPWWGRFGGINDRFALLGRDAAEAYNTTYQRLDQLLALGCPLHPESLIKASLEQADCYVDDNLDVEFSTLKHDCCRPPEITASDIHHH